jgi:hypothetical protein
MGLLDVKRRNGNAKDCLPSEQPRWSAGWRKELASWPGHWREAWEERAAILQYDGGLTREEAEWSALHEVQQCPPAPEWLIRWQEEWLMERGILRDFVAHCPDSGLCRVGQFLLAEVPTDSHSWLALGHRMLALEDEMQSRSYGPGAR